MNKKIILFLFSIPFSVLLSGCSEKDSNTSSRLNLTGNPPVTESGPQQGTGDSGGGNIYKGKPLDSYIKKPLALPAGIKYVKPAVAFMENDENIAMNAVLKGKTWYFVPGPLAELPKEKIGSAVPTEQIALQDFTQVWIDSDLFEKMSAEDQAQLIFHEVFMGIKLLKFTSPQEACLTEESGSDEYRKPNLERCRELSTEKVGKISDLTAVDYSQVRAISNKMLSKIIEVEAGSDHSEYWWEKAGFHGYKNKFNESQWTTELNIGNFHYQDNYWFSGRQTTRATHYDNAVNLLNALTVGYVPLHAYSVTELEKQFPQWKRDDDIKKIEGTWHSDSQCTVAMNKISDRKFKLEINFNGDTKIFEFDFAPKLISGSQPPVSIENTVTFNATRFWFNGELLTAEELTPLPETGSLGQRFDEVTAYYDSYGRLKHVAVDEMFWKRYEEEVTPNTRSLARSTWFAWRDPYLRGSFKICSQDQTIKLTNKNF